MKKILLWTTIGLVAAAGIAAVIWWFCRPQVVQLDKNTTLTLIGAEYGKHHKFPTTKTKTGRRIGSGQSVDTTNDTLVVWVLQETKGNTQRSGNWQAIIQDQGGTACVESWARNWSGSGNQRIAAVQVDTFPRRDAKFIMRFAAWGNNGRQVSKDQFLVSNPVHGKAFSQWTPASVPNTQSDGDLSVTLNSFATGAPSPYNRGGNVQKNDPMNKGVRFDFDAQQNEHAATNWHAVRVMTSDITGNEVRGWINPYHQNGQTDGYFYQPGLWQNEAAWKVKTEFSRSSGFNDDELWTVTNVPVRVGNEGELNNYWNWNNNDQRPKKAAFAETTIGDTHVKLFPAIQYTAQYNGAQKQIGFVLTTDPDPEKSGTRVTLVSTTDDQGHD